MFDGQSNIDPSSSRTGFVVDVSGCGTDDRVLRFAMLAGQRAVAQMLAGETRPTLRINDEGWRLASTLEGVRYMQKDFKLGRNDALANILVVHRFAEIGAQADGAVGEIANRLVSDADLHVMFRQGDDADAADSMERLRLPSSTREALVQLPARRCLIHLRGRLALLEVVLSRRMRTLADTNQAVRGDASAGDEKCGLTWCQAASGTATGKSDPAGQICQLAASWHVEVHGRPHDDHHDPHPTSRAASQRRAARRSPQEQLFAETAGCASRWCWRKARGSPMRTPSRRRGVGSDPAGSDRLAAPLRRCPLRRGRPSPLRAAAPSPPADPARRAAGPGGSGRPSGSTRRERLAATAARSARPTATWSRGSTTRPAATSTWACRAGVKNAGRRWAARAARSKMRANHEVA